MNNPAHSMKKRIARIVIRIQSFPLYKLIRTSLKPEIQVTEASVSDWDKVHEILNPNASDSPPQSGANVTNYVAKISNKIVGHVQLVAAQKEAGLPEGLWLFSLGVRLKYRRLGIGELLSCRVVQTARERDTSKLYLLVFEDNLPAIRLYHKLGFKQQALAAMEGMLKKEERISGRRRIVMALSLGRNI